MSALGNIWAAVRNTLKALRNGEFLLRIRADKYYMHIMYLFLLMWLTIMLSLRVDKTLAQAGENKAAIEELRIRHSEKEAELVKLESASATEARLRKMGSKLVMPAEPATVIKKK
ncbi:MAG: hypothetical protein J6W94_01115 [Bacteroidales bacterium]|nr:hypothetical protein [Bacteroidales bacterium]